MVAKLSHWIVDVEYSFDLMHKFELLFMKFQMEPHLDSVRIVKSHPEPYKLLPNNFRDSFWFSFRMWKVYGVWCICVCAWADAKSQQYLVKYSYVSARSHNEKLF